MPNHAAITVHRSREEVERLWDADVEGDVTFSDAPGERGTEIHVGTPHLAEAKDELRRFKQRVETGEAAVS